MKFGQVSHMRKTVYFSLSFLTHQHKFCAFFQVLVGTVAGCKWRVRTTDWPTLKATVKHPDLFALLRSGEIAGFDHNNKFTLSSFLDRIRNVDQAASVNGLA